MRILRFSGWCVLLVLCSVLLVAAQSQDQQYQLGNGPLPAFTIHPGASSHAPFQFIAPTKHRLVIKGGNEDFFSLGDPRELDRGIRLRGGSNTCGAIVSYNFSQGANPRLESITTCTPSNAVVPRRAKQPRAWPPRPGLQYTTLR